MPLTCAKCQRANPNDAAYCYYDGISLSNAPAGRNGGPAPAAGPVAIGAKPFSSPFTLPNGKQCQNFDQLALSCQENWSSATEALKQGYLEKFLAGQGRADLAMAAREAARFPDKDRGLDQFLAKLPSQAVKEPKLAVQPTDLNFGQLKIGENKTVQLQMKNQGMRLIYGSVAVENAPWLSLGTGAGAQQKLFQFGSDLSIPVNISGKKLRASNKALEGRLIVESNAGLFTIPVKAEVPVKPFPSGCLAGARSPRQVAEKAKTNPKESAPLFENNTVANWYKDNGWQYPVKGASASGLGAVQQFFEALGLTPPPKVEVDKRGVNFKGQPGATLRESLEIKAQEKRPVYAHATADQPWLEVGRARLNGRVATIPLTVSNVPARDGETLKAKVTITANGNQRFVIPVTLTIGGSFNFMAAAPVGAAGAAAAPVLMQTYAGKGARGKPVNLLPLILLFLCLFGVMIWDMIPWGSGVAGGPPPDDKEEQLDKIIREEGPKPYDNENRIAVLFTPETQRFGISILKLKDPRYPEKPKLLTRNERGNTNNTVVDIEGYPYVFGRESAGAGVRWGKDKGKVLKEVVSQDKRKTYSVMDYETEQIRITQTVEIVVGEGTRLYDTALVKYQIWNRDKKIHTVGIRAMMDTYIGLNDGAPFFIPPTEDDPQPKMVDTKIELEKEKIPQFVRVMETNDPNDPNATVAEMGLKLRGYEPINKLVICRWPQEWGGSEAKWDFPYEAMNKDADKGRDKDSCVMLYWSKLNMNPGEKRTVGYTYGLGRIAGERQEIVENANSRGKIRLFPGPAKAGRPFVAAAYVRNADGQTCTIKLPAGVVLASNEKADKPVKTEAGKDYAVVTWRVVAAKADEYILEATLSEGASSKARVKVPKESIFD
ncbi:MAG: hypothetical protein K2R98_13140 [Gemmataceae bacterium]|nr:hypothetical protein [Gemmataceae bacterium]